jgi:hypothetical protein
MQILENDNGRWVCPGEQNIILLGGRELSIYSVVLNNGMIVVNRDAQFDSREITSKDVEETYKFENGKLIKIEEKTIKLHEPLG